MKKLIIWAVLLCLLLTACTQAAPPEQLNHSTVSTTVPTTPASTTTVPTTLPTDEIRNNAINCQIGYTFYSITDLETYLTTGSKAPESYLKQPELGVNRLPSADQLLTVSKNYISVKDLFGIDESLFEKITATMLFADDGGLMYHIFIDDTHVFIEGAEKESLIQCFLENNPHLTTGNLNRYEKNKDIDRGYVIRECSGMEVIFEVRNGVNKKIAFVLDDLYITVEHTVYTSAELQKQEMDIFMSDNRTTKISNLFSTEMTSFDDAIAAIQHKNSLRIK